MNLHPHAAAAIRAAKLLPHIGLFAATQYLRKRGVPIGLLTLARQLKNMEASNVAKRL